MPDEGTVYAEVLDFGFGPAAGFIDLAEALSSRIDWRVASTGNALRFLRSALPTAEFIDFNGFAAEEWPQMPAFAPPGSLWLTMSNPRFADWAGGHGYPVVLVDQLYWMWGAPELGAGHYMHLAPNYFRNVSPVARNLLYTRPILAPEIASYRTPPETRHGSLLAFGGMAVAGQPTAGDAYARWVLELALPLLLEQTDEPVHIVGGSPHLRSLCAQWDHDQRVCFEGAMKRSAYLRLLGASRFQILTPGLSTIYECAELGLTPIFQPGANKSMVLQLADLNDVAPDRCAPWSWAGEWAPRLRALPQIAALSKIAELIAGSLSPKSSEGSRFVSVASDYLSGKRGGSLDLVRGDNLPSPHDVVDEFINSHRQGRT